MRKFRNRETGDVVEAAVWALNGDHPRDNCRVLDDGDGPFLSEGRVVRRHRNPDMAGDDICEQCRATYHDHGWIERANTSSDVDGGIRVCPGDVVVNEPGSELYDVIPVSGFNRAWELIVDVEATGAGTVDAAAAKSPMFDERAAAEDRREDNATAAVTLAGAAELLEAEAEKMTRSQAEYRDAPVPHLIVERITDLRTAAGMCRALIAGFRL